MIMDEPTSGLDPNQIRHVRDLVKKLGETRTILLSTHLFQEVDAMAQRVLLALTQAGVSREDAYRLVQRNAMKVWEDGADFKTELLGDAEVTAALSVDEIEEKFDLGYHTKHVDTIFARVFSE